MKYLIFIIGFLVIFFGSPFSLAQQKMELDDLNIKGELHNDDRLRILARQKNSLKNYVKYRTNYRQEIIQGLPKPKSQVKY